MVVSVLSMDEFEIIKNYFKRESFRSDVLLGIGDDGAVLDLKAFSLKIIFYDFKLIHR